MQKNLAFTVLEVLIALTLLTAASLAAVKWQNVHFEQQRQSYWSLVANQQIENLLTLYPGCQDCQCPEEIWQEWLQYGTAQLPSYEANLGVDAKEGGLCQLTQHYQIAEERRSMRATFPR